MAKMSDKLRDKMKAIKPVKISSEADIRKAIRPFQIIRKSGSVPISGEIKWVEVDENTGKKQNKKAVVTGVSEDANLRESFIQEFGRVRTQAEQWGKLQEALVEDAYSTILPVADIDAMYMSVDRIIKHRLGGVREGLTVVWRLNGKKYVFDPYTGNLDCNATD